MFPVVNLNGTSRESLIEQNVAALSAVRAALSTVCDAAPHGRDFQISPAGDYVLARKAHFARVEQLLAMTREFEAIAMHLAQGRGS